METASTSNAREGGSTLGNSHQNEVEGDQDDVHQSRLDEVQFARVLTSCWRYLTRVSITYELRPEVRDEFEFDRALEHVIKGKPLTKFVHLHSDNIRITQP